MKRFDLSDFKSPPREFTPIYSWLWNGPISKEETPYHERQLLFDRDTLDSGLYGPVKIFY